MCHDSCPKPVTGGAPIDETMATVSRDDAEIPVLLARPEAVPAPLPGIVLIHDINGANDFYRDLARRLAGEGYIVALPNLFHREGPPADDTKEAVRARAARAKQADQLGDLEAVSRWLTGLEGCSGSHAVMGFCMGGTLTFLLAARQPAPAASVAYYGFPARDATDNAPVRPIDEAELAALDSDLLAFWGDQDTGVGMETVDAYGDALVRHGKPHEIIVYPDIGHGFLTFDEASASYKPSQHAWRKTLGFLRRKLKLATAS
jgi:carboxymethylenebutenolidase